MDKQETAKKIIESFNRVGIVGLSPKKERPSNKVARYLIDHGYDVIGVNPGHKQILGRPCYPCLTEIEGPVEIVNVFRNPKYVPQVIAAAIDVGAKALWLQEKITCPLEEERARSEGILVVSDLCIKKAHAHLTSV